jgi:pSer/pThr/pTyr-binding forkhead associated (FHA) protein
MRFRLRHRQRELDLSEGSLSVGRSSTCQLFLDDPLVSRRHAVFLVASTGVTIEDQQSRNGVLVNGHRIEGRTVLSPGDKILIGSAELTLLAAPEVARVIDESAGRKTLSRVVAPAFSSSAPPPPATQPVIADADASTVRRMNAFKLLSEVAEKALTLGRADEAERLLSGPLVELVETSRSGHPLSPSLIDAVAHLAVRLASATGKGVWIDYVIELYRSQRRPCAAAVIDELNGAIRRVSAIDVVALRSYMALLHERLTELGPAERFLLQRLEGLERRAPHR